jgi:hypothetical protein
MGMNTFRNHRWAWRVREERAARRPAAERWNPQAAVYWRRRIVALMIGLAILSLIVWAFTGAIGGSGSAGGTGSARSTASQQQDLGGGGQRGAAAPSAGAGHGSHGQGPAGQQGSCRHGAVVLSLFTAQENYGVGEFPQFSVDVVGTGRQTCAFNVGASHVALIIRSGSVRVWNSADCVQGAGDLVTDLQRGVPTVLPISWNRRASVPGCHGHASRMPAGTYTATAADGWLTSNTVTFKIG